MLHSSDLCWVVFLIFNNINAFFVIENIYLRLVDTRWVYVVDAYCSSIKQRGTIGLNVRDLPLTIILHNREARYLGY